VDVARKRSKAGRPLRWTFALVALGGGVATVTAGLARLERKLPEFDRSSVVLDEVERGVLVREVRAPGTLVPVEVTWITSEVSGSVVEVLVEPGVAVTPDTVLLRLNDPQMERAVRDAKRNVETAEADLKRFDLQQHLQHLDHKVATATALANFRDAQTQVEQDEALARQGLISRRQRQISLDKAERNQMLLEVQIERVNDNQKAQQIQREEKLAWIERAKDLLAERLEQQEALIVNADVHGILQELGASAAGLQVGQRVSQGSVVAKVTDPGRLKAVLQISQTQARDIVEGQHAIVDTLNGVIEGRVSRIDPAVQNDRVTVDVELTGELPKGARPDLSVDGLIEVARLDDVLHVRKPVYGQEGSRLEVFRLEPDGETVSRTTVEFGSGSVYTIEVTAGLKEGDQIVVSDTTRWKSFDRVKLH